MEPGEGATVETIHILMAVCDGAPFLPDQLDSLSAQEHRDWKLLVSDDSADDTCRKLFDRYFRDVVQEVRLIAGPGEGSAANFLHLLRVADDGPVSFSDQDDVWLPEKLSRAVDSLSGVPEDIPALYCARVQPWNGAEGDTQAPTPSLRRPPCFSNALIENVATGNTILLNRAAARLARTAMPPTETVFAHDWWLYQLITGAGGLVIHDNGAPVLLYRQHLHNAIGAGRGLQMQAQRKRVLLGGAFADRLTKNAAALNVAKNALTAENAALLERFEVARRRRGPARVMALKACGVYRQNPLGTGGFYGMAALGLV
jgi:hypothetical protein